MLNNYKYGFRAIGNYVVPTYVTKNCVSLIRLAVESTIAMYGPSKDAAPKKSDREKRKAEQQQNVEQPIREARRDQGARGEDERVRRLHVRHSRLPAGAGQFERGTGLQRRYPGTNTKNPFCLKRLS